MNDVALALLASLPLAVPSLADEDPDTVVLKDGREETGLVVYEDHEMLILREGSRDTEIPMVDVAEVKSIARGLRELFREPADPWRPSDNRALARRATELGLERMARIYWWRVLAAEPDDAEAHEALGHREAGKSWKVRHQNRWVKMDKLREVAGDFGKGWELETPHYLLRTNVTLEEALDLALDLERLYVGFFDLFQEDLRLYETEEVMHVDVHADAASFPERAGETAYFQGGNNRVSVDASSGLVPYVLVHEAVHQLIYNTSVEERNYNGAVPAWLDEGLAEYVASSRDGPPGQLRLDPGKIRRDSFLLQARAKKPLSLSRTLNLSSGDFTTSDYALRYAHVYTLVHFLLHGQEGQYRDSFLNFVRGSYAGQGSSTHFKKSFEIKAKELESLWRGYVLQTAG